MIDEQALFVCDAQSLALRESTALFPWRCGQPRTLRSFAARVVVQRPQSFHVSHIAFSIYVPQE